MKKVRLALLAAVLVLAFAWPAAAAGPISSLTLPLMAGQQHDVGTVTVYNFDLDDLHIDIDLNDACEDAGWVILESHVVVGTERCQIPVNKKGNPVPGQFPYVHVWDAADAVTFDEFVIDIPGDDLFIAVHVHVYLPGSAELTDWYSSGTGTEYESGTAWLPASLAWVHPSWNDGLDEPITGADWVWETGPAAPDQPGHTYVDEPVDGDIVEFRQVFNVPGTPVGAELIIAADNGYEVEFAGSVVGSDNLYGDWRNSDLLEANVHSNGWQDVTHYLLTGLVEGENTLYITGVNEYMGPREGASGTVTSNPGGVIYKLGVTYVSEQDEKHETAWADGERFIDPGNWGMWFTYNCEGDGFSTDDNLNNQGGVNGNHGANNNNNRGGNPSNQGNHLGSSGQQGHGGK